MSAPELPSLRGISRAFVRDQVLTFPPETLIRARIILSISETHTCMLTSRVRARARTHRRTPQYVAVEQVARALFTFRACSLLRLVVLAARIETRAARVIELFELEISCANCPHAVLMRLVMRCFASVFFRRQAAARERMTTNEPYSLCCLIPVCLRSLVPSRGLHIQCTVWLCLRE